MSREVMGNASEDAARGGPGGSSEKFSDVSSELPLMRTHTPAGDPGTVSVSTPGASRRTVAAAVVGAAVVAGLVGAGSTAAVMRDGGDQPRVVAWLEFGDGGDYPGNDRISMVLNVVNAGQGEVVIDDVDLDGGLEAGAAASAIGVVLNQPIRVVPGAHAQQDVLVGVEDCESTWRPVVDDADGTLRVSVTGDGARSAWISGSDVGAFPVTPSVVVQSVCEAGGTGPVITQEMSVSADGELVMALRSTGSDAQVLEVTGPEGVRFTGQPSLPVTVPARDDGNVTVAIRLVVDDCTSEIERLDAAGQVRLVVDGQDVVDFDFILLHSWYVREVTRACG